LTQRLRLPDFLIIGAMKSATSTLYWWLREQPECFLAWPKEIDFFSSDDRWRRGVQSYGLLFEEAPAGRLLGEASVSYSHPDHSRVASKRIGAVVPEARIIYLVRHPVERLRSHYRHEVQRGRERRTLSDALAARDNPYADGSRYFSCLGPYIERFPREQICIVRFEDLVSDGSPGWTEILRVLGLPPRPSPGTAHNVTADHRQWSPAMAQMHRLGLLRFDFAKRLPAPIRRIGGRVLMRDGEPYRRRLEGSQEPIPSAAVELIWDDVDLLERWLGCRAPLWPRTPGRTTARTSQ
jgi:hypothetical protein